MYNEKLTKEIREADCKINNTLRNHRYLDGLKYNGEPCSAFEAWRKIGMLDKVTPGSWEETTLVILLENQRKLGQAA